MKQLMQKASQFKLHAQQEELNNSVVFADCFCFPVLFYQITLLLVLIAPMSKSKLNWTQNTDKGAKLS